jgi:hypothetical protein
MHFCTAYVALANDDQQVVHRGPFDPISWPEIEVLRTIHGDEAVREVKPFAFVEQTAAAEQQRLLNIYGKIVTEQVFRGRKPVIEMDAVEMDILDPGTMWMNPITREVKLVDAESTIGDKPAASEPVPNPIRKKAKEEVI